MNPRYDIYRNVHKGLRRELSLLVADAGAVDVECPAEVAALAARFRDLRALLEAHHIHEDDFIGPHLRRLAPELATEMEAAHGELDRRLYVLASSANRLLTAVDLHAFYIDLASFASRYTSHMEQEERVYNGVLQAAFTDAELTALDGAIVASIEPRILASFLVRMMPALSPAERAALLGEMRASAPPAAFEGLCELVRAALPPAAWTALRARVLGPTSTRISSAPREVAHV